MQRGWSLLHNNQSYETEITLTEESKQELRWWLYNLQQWNGKAIISPNPDLMITTDASKKGWGAVCQNVTTQGLWSPAEAELHINVLELMAASFAVKSFTKNKQVRHVHLRVDNSMTMAQINKMGGPRSKSLLKVTLPLWHYCLSRVITLTAIADRESRVYTDASNWKLLPAILCQIELVLGRTEIDMFADRLNTQKEKFWSWKADLASIATDEFNPTWTEQFHSG